MVRLQQIRKESEVATNSSLACSAATKFPLPVKNTPFCNVASSLASLPCKVLENHFLSFVSLPSLIACSMACKWLWKISSHVILAINQHLLLVLAPPLHEQEQGGFLSLCSFLLRTRILPQQTRGSCCLGNGCVLQQEKDTCAFYNVCNSSKRCTIWQ